MGYYTEINSNIISKSVIEDNELRTNINKAIAELQYCGDFYFTKNGELNNKYGWSGKFYDINELIHIIAKTDAKGDIYCTGENGEKWGYRFTGKNVKKLTFTKEATNKGQPIHK